MRNKVKILDNSLSKTSRVPTCMTNAYIQIVGYSLKLHPAQGECVFS